MGVSLTNFEFSGDASKAQAELRRLADANRALESAMNKMARTSEQTAKGINNVLKEQYNRVKSLVDENDRLRNKLEELRKKNAELDQSSKGTFSRMMELVGALGITGTINKAIAAQKEWIAQIKATGLAQDELGRKFQVQALMGDKQFQETLKTRIVPAAIRAALPLQTVQEVATEMVSKGFSVDEATGGALGEILIGAKATNAPDVKTFATAIASYLKSQGKELTPEAVRSVTAPLTSLYQKTAFQGADLLSIAGIGALAKNFRIKQDELFASAVTLKDVGGLDIGEATTSTRNIATILAAARGNKKVLAAIRAVGGEGFESKIDLSGESFGQALGALRNQLAGLDEPSRNTAIARIFGKENLAAASTLMANLPTYQRYQEIQRDTSKFREGVEIATSGPAAAVLRAQLRRQQLEIQESQRVLRNAAFREELANEEIRAGIHPLQRGAREGMRSTLSALGVDVRKAELGEDFWFSGPAAFSGDDWRRAWAADKAAREGRGAAKIPDIQLPDQGPIAPIPEMPTINGPGRSVNFTPGRAPKRVTPANALALELDDRNLELMRAEHEMKMARREAKADNVLTDAEKARLAAMDKVVDGLRLAVEALKIKQLEDSAAKKRDKPLEPVDREAQR